MIRERPLASALCEKPNLPPEERANVRDTALRSRSTRNSTSVRRLYGAERGIQPGATVLLQSTPECVVFRAGRLPLPCDPVTDVTGKDVPPSGLSLRSPYPLWPQASLSRQRRQRHQTSPSRRSGESSTRS